MSLSERWTGALEELRGQGRFRSLKLPRGLDFTSNDYLGYGARVAPTGEPVMARSGIASRLLRGHHAVWDEVESSLAAWHGADAVLMMNSGFSANEGLISTVVEPGDWVASDELNHACIVEGLRVCRPRKFVFRHNDLNHLEDGLRAEAAKRPAGRELFIVTESLFSMDGDRAPLCEIVALAERYGAGVIVDEAHSTGCFGPGGSGVIDELGLRDRVLATVHTGGKAIGVTGAYVCGSRLLKDYLVNKCRHLIFTTALPPIVGNWWLDALDRVRSGDADREKLHANAAAVHRTLARHSVPTLGDSYIIPVVLGDDPLAVRVATRLQERGYDVRAIRPPSVPQGTARLRLSIHADHDPAVLQRMAEHVAEAVRDA
ncbi:aminotransferase class I/II-fold pyridoxal phosphate-dependent enzyme [Limnoglobus roseus]|uniref:8-amino-7-oxononanoate synthase n=1 Tax=Limnoglobus roseus TaxID=2598579 RepID=A0A5C1AF62_9BACT|nr:8-amino-7-oxononanoate synthase [Limnoglobus roseus]QEL17891.1 8-amino-7-oxononanoate synthase [Limnoglobus roseus]